MSERRIPPDLKKPSVKMTHDQRLKLITTMREEFKVILGESVNSHIYDRLELACWRTLDADP